MAENQAYLFLIFSFTGIIIGVLFDFFRILRRTIKTSNIATYIEDVLFWVLTGFLILYNIMYFNSGEIRIYMFLAIILGVLIYMFTLSNILIKIFSKILKVIIITLETPIKWVKAILSKLITIIVKIFTKTTKKFIFKKRNFENNGE